MSSPHYIAGVKILVTAIGAVIFAMDPTVKTFLFAAAIVSIPPTITGIFSIIKMGKLGEQMNGINSRLEDKNKVQGAQLAIKSEEAAHAAGRREGSEAERKDM